VWEELTQMQIAERLGVSQMTVSRRLRTIYARLGAWLVTAGAA
jgi:DNA-directed RNA polymerase specialized sigma subunit